MWNLDHAVFHAFFSAVQDPDRQWEKFEEIGYSKYVLSSMISSLTGF
jgi:hypothetical protein